MQIFFISMKNKLSIHKLKISKKVNILNIFVCKLNFQTSNILYNNNFIKKIFFIDFYT